MGESEHIIIDGYNAIYAHPYLRGILLTKSQDAARAALREMISPVHDFGTGMLTIVYDGSGAEISIARDAACKTFSEVFTPSFMTADELIERLCAVSANPSKITVVTRDNLLRLTSSSFGALSIHPDSIFETAKKSAGAIAEATRKNNFDSSREWKKTNPFFELDALAADLSSAMRSSPLLSKRLKKKLARGSSEKETTESVSDSKSRETVETSKIGDIGKDGFGALAKKRVGKIPQEFKFGRMKLFGGKASTKSLLDLKSSFGNGKSFSQKKRAEKK